MNTGLLFLGIFILILIMVRLMYKNRRTNEMLKKTTKKIEERKIVDGRDFGQKIKWAVDIDDGKQDRPAGGTEPPTGGSR